MFLTGASCCETTKVTNLAKASSFGQQFPNNCPPSLIPERPHLRYILGTGVDISLEWVLSCLIQ